MNINKPPSRLKRWGTRLLNTCIASFAFLVSCPGAVAADFPSKPISLVVPGPPGGPTDSA